MVSDKRVGKLVPKIIMLAELCFRFARTDRFTQLPDGKPESDTDHSYTLAVIACSVAASYDKNLDVGKVAQYSLVHDLVEVYAKDTATAVISDRELVAKSKREADALKQIKSEFGNDFPWIPDTIERYEKLADPEARFVKVLDKAMPAITHLFNDAAYLRSIGIKDSSSRQTMLRVVDERVRRSVSDQPLAHAIRDALESEASKLFVD